MLYYSKSTSGFYDTDFHKNYKIPHDAVQITKEQYDLLMEGQAKGYSIQSVDSLPTLVQLPITPENSAEQERLWRNSELTRADIELYKVQDSDPNAVGTVSQWREYRRALRNWPTSELFANKEFRPVSPDA
jgi:hypothetical protein